MNRARTHQIALLLRLGSTLVFAIMFMLIKYGSERGLSVAEIVFWRQVPTAPIILLWLWYHGELHRLRTERIKAHSLRSMVGLSNMTMTFTAATLLPLPVTTTLGFTTPLFAVLLSVFVFRERIGKWRWSSVLLGFAGVLIVAQPGGAAINPLGAGLALAGGCIVAVINYQIRDLGKTEEAIRTVFYFGLFGTLLTLPAMLLTTTAHDARDWAILIGLGICGLFGQLLLTASLRQGTVVNVLVVDYATLLWTALLGWLVWNHTPGYSLWLGAPLIVLAGLIVVWREQRLHRQPTPAIIGTSD